MKKIILFYLFFHFSYSFCQDSIAKQYNIRDLDADKAFGTYAQIVNIGAGYNFELKDAPMYTISYEFGLPNMLSGGYIGVGGYASYIKFKVNTPNYISSTILPKETITFYSVAARVSYHLDVESIAMYNPFLAEKLDIYCGLVPGLRFENGVAEKTVFNPEGKPYYNLKPMRFFLNAYGGIHILITDDVGIFAEVGYGKSYSHFGAGIAIKL